MIWLSSELENVSENKLLEKGLFLESEILGYFDQNVLKIFSSNARTEIQSYWERNTDISKLRLVRRQNFDIENSQLPISEKARDHIFLVCIFDESQIIFRIISGSSGNEIPFEPIKKGFMEKLMNPHSRQAIRLKVQNNRKKVLINRVGNATTYSVLPEGYDVYYFDESVNLSGIKIKYLSSLIGQSEND